MQDIKHMLDQCCADFKDSWPTLNKYGTNLAGNCVMSGGPLDAIGQYINIFEECIIIQNDILNLLYIPGYIILHQIFFLILVVIFPLPNLQ